MGSSQLSFQLVHTQLVSSPAGDQHSSAIAPRQHAGAIALLKDEDDSDIFAWLQLARSLEQGLPSRSDLACLTRDQVRAIGALRHCKSDDITAWLRLARMPGTSKGELHARRELTFAVGIFGTSAVTASPQFPDQAADQGHIAPTVLSDASRPGPLVYSAYDAPYQQASMHSSSPRRFPTPTLPTPQAQPKYYCTLCAHYRPFKNQSDWRKHEREHDTTYVCMLKGPREVTPQGIQCAFCGILNPLDGHLSVHDAQKCLHGPPGSFSSKRRHELVNHLSKIHHIHQKSQGEAIAVKWKHTVEKQAWSCGFCVIAFASFSDRLTHIAAQHFEDEQTIDKWDTTKVIQGLLQQPGMIEAWGQKLASLPTWVVEAMVWGKDAMIGLRHDLEVGPNYDKSAVELAEAAYVACRLN